MKYTAITLFMLLLFLSCKENQQHEKFDIKSSSWIIGNWSCKTQNGILAEKWIRQNDSVYSGTSTFTKNNDTIRFESFTLNKKGNELLLNCNIKSDITVVPETYVLQYATETALLFKNKNNSFPEQIEYKKDSPDLIELKISGLVNKKLRSEIFVLEREIEK